MEKGIHHFYALHLADKFNKYLKIEGTELIKMTFGIEVFLINLTKLVVIYFLSAFLGIINLTLVTHLAFVLTKRYSFGLHSLSSIRCTIISSCMFVFIPYALSGMAIDNYTVASVFAVIIFLLYKYAPADTKARPIIGKQNRVDLKKKAVYCGIGLMVAALFIPSGKYKLLLMLGAVYQILSITPLTYKLLKRSEKNYEEFE